MAPDESDPEREALSPGRAFTLLGNETRLDTIRALWAAEGTLSFSELHDAVGLEDSGQFNYHLKQLVGNYVEHGPSGYQLSPAGRHVMSAILAGAVDRSPRLGTIPIEGACVHCGGTLEAEFEAVGTVSCQDCGRSLMTDAFPPAGGVGRDRSEIPRAFDIWLRNRSLIARQGICPQCAAPVDTTVEFHTKRDLPIRGSHRCRNCKHEESGPIYVYVLDHPAVVSLFYDHGIDIRTVPYWELRHYFTEFSATVDSEDPLRISVTVPVEDDSLRLTLDETLGVVAVDESIDAAAES